MVGLIDVFNDLLDDPSMPLYAWPIPPTKNALYQYIRRAFLQASFIWEKCLQTRIVLLWGWEYDETKKIRKPFWTDLADASKACRLLKSCGCKVACRGRCSCASDGLRCTALCFGEGGALTTTTSYLFPKYSTTLLNQLHNYQAITKSSMIAFLHVHV